MSRISLVGNRVGLLTAALAMAVIPASVPVLEVKRLTPDEDEWAKKPDPDNRGRRAEKNAAAIAKAEAKRQRKAAKRLAQVQK